VNREMVRRRLAVGYYHKAHQGPELPNFLMDAARPGLLMDKGLPAGSSRGVWVDSRGSRRRGVRVDSRGSRRRGSRGGSRGCNVRAGTPLNGHPTGTRAICTSKLPKRFASYSPRAGTSRLKPPFISVKTIKTIWRRCGLLRPPFAPARGHSSPPYMPSIARPRHMLVPRVPWPLPLARSGLKGPYNASQKNIAS
jgi:hypothetical protein